MKKLIKIILFSVLGLVVLILGAAIAIPLFFKDDIKLAVDEQLQEFIKGNINYDEESFSLSLISDFPDLQVSVADFSLVNQAPFAGDTLASIRKIDISVDVMSAISDELVINSVYLGSPRIFAKVNEKSEANWDIAIPDTTAVEEESSSTFKANIEHWEIEKGYVEFEDDVLPMLAVIENLNHEGNGEIADIIKINTSTSADKVYVNFAGITYLDDVKLDAVTNLEQADTKLTFKENNLTINDLSLNFDGYTDFLEESIDLDLGLHTEKSTFKNLMSLIPAVFLNGYENVEADGEFDISAELKGMYSDHTFPTFDFKTNVANANFKHPDLPKKVSDINLNLHAFNNSEDINETTVDLSAFSLTMGSNSTKGRFKLEGLENYNIDTEVKANINLGEIKDYYPLEGTQLQGNLDLNVLAKGKVDVENEILPRMNARADLRNGFVKSADFDLPIENLAFNTLLTSDGTISGAELNVKNLGLEMDQQKFGGEITVRDFEAYNYNANVNGSIDLGKILEVFPIEGMDLTGLITISELKTEGNLDAINNERYDLLKTSGSAQVKNLNYKDSEYLPYGLKITNAQVSFTPEKININSYNGFVAENDINVTGHVSNYMGYVFGTGDTILDGNMVLKSNNFDVNPFLVEEEGSATAPTGEEELEIATVPSDINFSLNSSMKKVIYDDLTLENLVGIIEVTNGTVNMKGVKFNTLGAGFVTNGTYDPRDIKHPKYDFDLQIEKMPIKEAYTYFSVVQELSPIAKAVDGLFSTKLKMNGELMNDYTPNISTLFMDADVAIEDASAKVSDVPMVNGLASKTKIGALKNLNIKDQLLKVAVRDGKLSVNPFTLNSGDSKMTLQLNTGLVDSKIDHKVNLDLPSSAISSGIGALGLDASSIGDRINLDFDVLGTRTKPSFKLTNSGSSGVKAAVKEKVNEKIDEKKDEAKAKALAEKERLKEEAEAKAKAEKDRLKKEAEEKALAEKERLKKEAEEKAKDALKNSGLKIPKFGK